MNEVKVEAWPHTGSSRYCFVDVSDAFKPGDVVVVSRREPPSGSPVASDEREACPHCHRPDGVEATSERRRLCHGCGNQWDTRPDLTEAEYQKDWEERVAKALAVEREAFMRANGRSVCEGFYWDVWQAARAYQRQTGEL